MERVDLKTDRKEQAQFYEDWEREYLSQKTLN